MAKIHQRTVGEKLSDQIYAAVAKADGNEQWLTRLGASQIGNECRRALWYSWRGFTHKPFGGRLLRLFKTGHLQEDRIVEDLQRMGLQVWAMNEDTGKQFVWLDETGHFICKPDGVIKGGLLGEEPLVLEIKTHSDKSFQEVRTKGVKASKREHYWQMHAGMWLSGLQGAVYVALNKNDEQYYIEIIERDEHIIDQVWSTTKAVIGAYIPPAKVNENMNWYGCTWCDHREVCAGDKPPLKNCRTCRGSDAMNDGVWHCTKHGMTLGRKEQLKGCQDYEGY